MKKRILKLIKRFWASIRYKKIAAVNLHEAVVSFSFDDAPASAFENGGGILSGYGYRGTFYIALSLLNHPDPQYTYNLHHLQQAFKDKHELGCHTYGHIDLSDTQAEQSIADIEKNQLAAQALFPQLVFNNFSYPFGAQTLFIKKHLNGRFQCARGVGHGINGNKTDLYNLKAVRLYRDKFSLEEIFRIIEKAVKQKAWLIFYTHDVQNKPSEVGCDTDYFEAVVKKCFEKKIKVLPVEEVINELI